MSGSTYSAIRAAEEYVLTVENEENVVSLTKSRALQLRAMAGEASLKLSERASDSADSVLDAATLLRNLNTCLQQVRIDVKDSMSKLKALESDLNELDGDHKPRLQSKLRQQTTAASSAPAKATAPQPSPKDGGGESALSKKSREGALGYFGDKTIMCERVMASAATSSNDWIVCVMRVSEDFLDILQAVAKESADSGWIGKFPEWSTSQARSFVQKHFMALALSSSWTIVKSLKGHELSEEQWTRLGEGSRLVIHTLAHFSYLFLQESEPILLKLVATLLSRAKEDMVHFSDSTNFNDPNHPVTRAVRILLPLMQSHRLVCEIVAPVVLVRCSMLLQGLEERHKHDARMTFNTILMPAGVSLLD